MTKIRLLLLLPTALLCVVFIYSIRFLVGDDVAYWTTAFEWKRVFEESSFFSALWQIHGWQAARASYQPLLAVPYLWVTGNSIDASVIGIGVTLSAIFSWQVFRCFKALAISDTSAIWGALVVATLPFLLGQARFFTMEYLFVTMVFCALAALLNERYFWFSIFFALSLCVRTVEGFSLLPAYYLLLAAKKNSLKSALNRPLIISLFAGAVIFSILFFRRAEALIAWIQLCTYPVSGVGVLSRLHLGKETLSYVATALFLIFGFSGVSFFAISSFFALRSKEFRILALVQLLLFILLCAFLVANSYLESAGGADAFYRYALAFFTIFFFISVAMVLKTAPMKMRVLLLSILFMINLIPYFIYLFPNKIHNFQSYKSVIYNYSMVRSLNDPSREKGFISELRSLIDDKERKIILVAGRDGLLRGESYTLTLRAQELGLDWLFVSDFPNRMFKSVFAKYAKHNYDRLDKYDFDYVIFAPKPIYFTNQAYPSEELVLALERGEMKALGLKLIEKLKTELPGSPQDVFLYSTSGR